jgi:Tol biopolymer transport system component
MPDVQEVFRMSTQKVRQDPGAMERQLNRQRKAARNRKAGAFAVAAAIVATAVVVIVSNVDRANVPIVPPPSVPVEPSEPGQQLSVVDVGSGTTTVFTAPMGASGFDFTLDGSMVTYTDLDTKGHQQVYVMDADGSNLRQITHSTLGVAVMESPPQWSPDGATIAYWVSLPGGHEVFVVRPSDGVSTRVTHEPTDVLEGGWASDRSFVFSTSTPTSTYPLLARSIDLATGRTVTIARDVSNPEVSPDGTQIAFDSYFRPRGEAWLSVMNIDGTGRRKIQHVSYSGSYPRWSPDGTQIAYFDAAADGGPGTYVYDLRTGETRFLTAGRIESWVDNDHMLVS